MVKKIIIALMLLACIQIASAQCEYGQIEANATYNMSNYTCIQVKAAGNENYGLMLCEAASNNCTYYNATAFLPLDITKDYILRVTPIQIQSSSDIVAYYNQYRVWLNLVLLIILFFVIYGFIKVAL